MEILLEVLHIVFEPFVAVVAAAWLDERMRARRRRQPRPAKQPGQDGAEGEREE